jgi:hypothetical protein
MQDNCSKEFIKPQQTAEQKAIINSEADFIASLNPEEVEVLKLYYYILTNDIQDVSESISDQVNDFLAKLSGRDREALDCFVKSMMASSDLYKGIFQAPPKLGLE